jgi:hypothetical protein
MEDVREYEEEFFKHGDFSEVSDRMGTRYLQEYLNR